MKDEKKKQSQWLKCQSPVKIQNPNYTGPGNPSEPKELFVPCGRCPVCRTSDASSWRARLQEEMDVSCSAIFITLTYDDSHLPLEKISLSDGLSRYVPTFSKRDIQLFLKRLRETVRKSYLPMYDTGKAIRYFIVSEYGPTTLRPHYHGVIFNLCTPFQSRSYAHKKVTELIRESWNNGNVRVDIVNDNRIAYVTKYMSCVCGNPAVQHLPKPFRLMSRMPGIGASYLEKEQRVRWHKENLAKYIPDGQYKRKMSKYYVDRIFSEDERRRMREEYQVSVENYRLKYLKAFNKAERGDSSDLDKLHKEIVAKGFANDRFLRHYIEKYTKTRKEGYGE